MVLHEKIRGIGGKLRREERREERGKGWMDNVAGGWIQWRQVANGRFMSRKARRL